MGNLDLEEDELQFLMYLVGGWMETVNYRRDSARGARARNLLLKLQNVPPPKPQVPREAETVFCDCCGNVPSPHTCPGPMF